NQITAIRTAATAAVAVDALAPRRPLRVAMIGSGFEARSQLNALHATRSIESVAVFSPTPASRQRFADDFRKLLGMDIIAADTPHSLSDLIGGRIPARSPDEIAVYKSVGSALQDVVIAEMLLQRARSKGVGTLLPVSIAPVKK